MATVSRAFSAERDILHGIGPARRQEHALLGDEGLVQPDRIQQRLTGDLAIGLVSEPRRGRRRSALLV